MSRERHGRIDGRAGVALRKRRRAEHPICAHCIAKGIVTETQVIDHIIPLAEGGLDVDENCQGLCNACHEAKTAMEQHGNHAATNHPEWLKPSAIPLKIIAGPPCAGKTTLVNNEAGAGDTIICLDSIMMEMRPGYRHWSNEPDKGLFNQAIRARNALLGSLQRRTEGKAWFIVTAATQQERDWWQEKLGGELVLLDPGAEECRRRADGRGTPLAKAGIDKWYAAKEWKRLKVIQQVGTDGWPVT